MQIPFCSGGRGIEAASEGEMHSGALRLNSNSSASKEEKGRPEEKKKQANVEGMFKGIVG